MIKKIQAPKISNNKRYFTILLIISCISKVFAQPVCFYPQVQKIMQIHCMVCHQKGMNTPFVFDSYESFAVRIPTILKVINENIMPPFPADTAYVKYHNQNVLTISEKQTIQKWADSGLKKGKISDNKSVKTIVEKKLKSDSSILLRLIPEGIEQGADKDIYTYTILKWYFKKPISVVDYNFKIKVPYLHHTEILSMQADSFLNKTDSTSVQITNSYENRKIRIDKYLMGWFPGSSCGIFPYGTKMTLDSTKKFFVISHYIPTVKKFADSSQIQIHISTQPNLREINEFAVHGTRSYLTSTNHAVFIPANTVKSFHYVEIVDADLSVFAVYGHAHHLCKNMLAYAVTPTGDTIPLLRINKWKFDWQLTYRFSKYLKIPQNSVVHFLATFDNTANNPENSHNPPKDVYASFMADDEMMEFFMLYVDYKNGDEKQKIQYKE